MPYKIEIDHEKCIGCGACASTCNNFDIREGKAHARRSKINEIGCSQDAADICPVQAITVTKA